MQDSVAFSGTQGDKENVTPCIGTVLAEQGTERTMSGGHDSRTSRREALLAYSTTVNGMVGQRVSTVHILMRHQRVQRYFEL
jgi:hypothetical protein